MSEVPDASTQIPAETALAVLREACRASGVEYDDAVARRELVGGRCDVAALIRAAARVGLRLTDLPASDPPTTNLLGTPLLRLGDDGTLAAAVPSGRRARLVGDGRTLSRRAALRRLERVAGRWLRATPLAGCGAAAGHGHHHLPPLRRLMALLRPERADVVTLVVFAVAVGVLSLAVPLAVEMLVTSVAFGGVWTPLVVLSVLLGGVLLFSAALRATMAWVVEILQRRLFVRLLADLSYRLPRVRRSALDGHDGAELVNRFFDVVTVQKAAAGLLLDGLLVVLNALVGLTVLAFYDTLLLGFGVFIAAAVVFAAVVLGRGAVRTAIDESIAKYAAAAWLEELARHESGLRDPAAADWALRRTDRLAARYVAARAGHFAILFRQLLFVLGLQAVASTGLLGLGGYLVIEGQLTLGQLVAAELIVTVVVGSLAKLGKHVESFYDLMAAVDKLGHLLDLPVEQDGAEASAATGPAALTLAGATLSYPGGAAVGPLELALAPGDRTVWTLPAGGGKSTVADLACGLRTPRGGRVLVDGVEVQRMRACDLRRRVAVAGSPEIVSGSVLDNIRMGDETVPLADVYDALDLVDPEGLLRSHPQGVFRELISGGPSLADGERRLLSLARALVRRPGLLVVDGLLDAMPERRRRAVYRALADRQRPWTLLVLTVLDDGFGTDGADTHDGRPSGHRARTPVLENA